MQRGDSDVTTKNIKGKINFRLKVKFEIHKTLAKDGRESLVR